MKLTGRNEWLVIGVLILYIALMPGFQVVRDLLSTGVGKAVGLSVIVYVWKYVSEPVALLLLVNYIRCSGSVREMMENPNMHCPAPFMLQPDNTCKDDKGNPGPPASVCMPGQTWDGSRCVGTSSETKPETAPAPTSPPGSTPPAMTTPTAPPPPPPSMVDTPVTEGFQPNQKDDKYAPA
jgi:hypothetical protein